uniref:Putative conserved secreted protein n=1 Tax=Ixodes ricinus TaxID=34613 RepID=A0A6B0UT18_IXORI
MRLQLFMLTVGAGAIFCFAGDGDRGIQNSVETTTFDLTDDELEAMVQGLGQCTYRYIDYDGRKATIGCMATCGQTETSVQARHDSEDSEKITLELSDKLCIGTSDGFGMLPKLHLLLRSTRRAILDLKIEYSS